MIEVFALYAICALTFTVSKAILLYSSPFFAVAVRMLIAGLLIGGYQIWSQRHSINTKNITTAIMQDWPLLLRIILFHIAVPYAADAWALSRITSIESSLLYNLSPFVAVFFAYLWFSERMNLKKWLGLTIGFCSTVPLIINHICSAQACTIKSFIPSLNILPLIATLGSVLSSAYAWIVFQKLIRERGYSVATLNAIAMIGGGISCGILALLTGECARVCLQIFDWMPFLGLTGLIILLANIVFYNGYGMLLRRYSAPFLAFAGFSTPLFVALFGFIFLGEQLSCNYLLATLCVVIGLYMYYHGDTKNVLKQKDKDSL